MYYINKWNNSFKNNKIITTRNLRLLFNKEQQQHYSTIYPIITNPISLSFHHHRYHHNHRLMTKILLYCICINCSRVTNCTAYHFVETKHEQPHMTLNPTFTPSDGNPTIHVNIRTIRSTDDVINRIRNEHDYETKHATKVEAGNNNNNNNLHGNTIYDVTPITTYEYDVVKCIDYIEDIGCWIRNMPEEIRIANPNFVPT